MINNNSKFLFLRAATIYYVLSVYVSPPTDSFTDLPVYPPMTIQEEEERIRSRSTPESNLGTPGDEKAESDFV
jgi:NCS1 family nucleobase:cation symporter-1